MKPAHPFKQLALTAKEADGILISVPMPDREKWNRDLERRLKLYWPGCGELTSVSGTNGGRLPCGTFLTRFGGTTQEFCAWCSYNMEKNKWKLLTAPPLSAWCPDPSANPLQIE